jgi:hypothetical protein
MIFSFCLGSFEIPETTKDSEWESLNIILRIYEKYAFTDVSAEGICFCISM